MARWIAFDQETTSLLRSNLAQGTRIDMLRRGPVDYALARATSVITVLPDKGDGGPAGIAVFRPTRNAAIHVPPASTIPQRPSPPPATVTRPPASARPAEETAIARPTVQRAGTRASGFLGLSDEPVFEEEVVEEKKGWWRRLWEE